VAYRLEYAAAFARDFRRLPRAELVRVDRVIQSLREEPRPPGARAIRGFPSCYRLRSGQYRLVYEVKDRTLVILLLVVGHRREIYERLKRRAKRRDS
jgi:mRNA interferase RelE/StbE